MFTGIITDIGRVAAIEHLPDSARLTITAHSALRELTHGASIAVDGVCLTAADFSATYFVADVMAETLKHTTIGSYQVGTRVNLERALPATGRFDGHIVQGHVDGTAEVVAIEPGEKWTNYFFQLPRRLGHYLVNKGSIAINGTSLTLTTVTDQEDRVTFGVSLIPTTLAETALSDLRVGTKVNIEVDVVAKYIERLVTPQ